jgi:hypothetical protein
MSEGDEELLPTARIAKELRIAAVGGAVGLRELEVYGKVMCRKVD